MEDSFIKVSSEGKNTKFKAYGSPVERLYLFAMLVKKLKQGDIIGATPGETLDELIKSIFDDTDTAIAAFTLALLEDDPAAIKNFEF